MKLGPASVWLLPLLMLGSATGQAAGAGERQALTDAARQIEYAKGALETLDRDRYLSVARGLIQPHLSASEPSCGVLLTAAEIELRAEAVRTADSYLDRAEKANCAPPHTLQLRSAYLEFGRDGKPFGRGARLVEAEASWVRAAELFLETPGSSPDRAAESYARAATLAGYQNKAEASRAHAHAGLAVGPSPELQTELGLLALRAGARNVGEGQAAEELHALVGTDAMERIVLTRVEELRARLDDQSKAAEPHDLASFGFYAVVSEESYEKHAQAARYLHQALGLLPSLPDAHYLLGRAFITTGKIEEGLDAFKAQIRIHPGTQASRLATNALAYQVAHFPTNPEEVLEVLRLLEAELRKTPDEAAMHETRARLLVARGKRAEACAAARKAAELAGDDQATRAEALNLIEQQDCE